jgi:hypothetical protein
MLVLHLLIDHLLLARDAPSLLVFGPVTGDTVAAMPAGTYSTYST